MTILTTYTSATYKAEIRSSAETGFKKLYSASSTSCDLYAAKSVVRKFFGDAAAASVLPVTDPAEIRSRLGKFFDDPRRTKKVSVWSFEPKKS